MMKTASTRHSSQSSAVFIAATVAALLGNLQVAEAKTPKVDPAIAAAITTASTSNIEDITALGSGIGTQIANKSIKLTPTNVNALVGGLVNAINTKTENPADPLDPNRPDNQEDEIAEVAAFIMGSLLDNVKTSRNVGLVKKYAVAVVKNALKSTLVSADLVANSLLNDVVSSVALTIHSEAAITDKNETKIAKALQKVSKTIAGKVNKTAVAGAFAAGFAADPVTSLFEDGNNPLLAVSDPETDLRNL